MTNRDGDHSAGAAICRRLRHQGSHTGGHPEAQRLLRLSSQTVLSNNQPQED